MQKLLKTLEKKYGYPVDTEFTVNFLNDRTYRVNLLQCRPLQTKGSKKSVEFPTVNDESLLFFKIEGNFMGGNISRNIKKIIFVEPKGYSDLNESRKYTVARLIGRLARMTEGREEEPVMLMGPGRWGTSTTSLGIPISFSEISNIAVLCEIAFEMGGMTPELSYGSHFFQDLVEDDIFYAAIFPKDKDVFFNKEFLLSRKNILKDLIPEAQQYEDVVKVFETDGLQVISDVMTQKVLCYLAK